MTSFIAVFAGTALAMIGAVSGDRADHGQVVLLGDIRTGVFITLTISFVMVACSVGVSTPVKLHGRTSPSDGTARSGAGQRSGALRPGRVATLN